MAERKVKDKRSDTEKMSGARKMILSAIATSGATFYYAYNNVPIDTSGLKTNADKQAFAMQWLFLSGLSMLTGVAGVLHVRGNSSAMDPIEGNSEHLVEIPNRILRNTTEQFIIHAIGLLTLTTYLTPEGMKAIPILVVIFVLGRIFFWLGYHIKAMYRAFGFAMTFAPSVAVVIFCLYQFISKYVMN